MLESEAVGTCDILSYICIAVALIRDGFATIGFGWLIAWCRIRGARLCLLPEGGARKIRTSLRLATHFIIIT
jgi:hypothetical protein